MKYKRISDFPKSQAESISVLGVEDGHNVQIEVLSKSATLQNIQKGGANKADKDGNYPKMTAGFAQEIVGDGSATPEEFSFRPTAGEDRNVANTIYYDGGRNGVARIEKIKGNSLVYNQLVTNGTFTGGIDGKVPSGWVEGSYYMTTRADISYPQDGGMLLTTIEGKSGNGSLMVSNFKNPNASDVLYFAVDYKSDFQWGFGGDTGNAVRIHLPASTQKTSYRSIKKFTTAPTRWGIQLLTYWTGVKTLWVNNIQVINLTKIFGAGNEPTTVEEFYQRLPVGINLNAYNEGTIIDGNYGAIKTVGFNAFNGTYAKVCAGCPYYLGGNYTSLGFTTEEGGTLEAITIPTSAESVGTTPSDRLYTPLQNGYIYAEGTNININISWGTEYGYLNGTYQPYKPFERNLSWIKTIKDSTGNAIFQNGMRSAGSARDEIRFNSTTQKWEAVQNVGAVDLGTLNWVRSEHLFGGVSPSGFRADIANTQFTNSNKVLPNILCSVLYTIETNTMASTSDSINLSISAHNVHPQRVFVRYDAYTDASAFKTAMSGVMLNYELAEPIVTEIEEMPNMDFDVSDYGTEELVASEGKASAPIVADISYAPNALSTLKQVPDILKRLKALESAVASATATTNEEETVE